MKYIDIGSLIKKVTNNKNSKLLNLPLLGLHIEKKFIPSVANIIGTDMSKYQIIRKWQFAYTGMQVGRDESLHVALYDRDDPALITPAYTIFEVKDISEILPEYLMLYLRRPESDRLGWFYSDSSVRSNLDWDRFCSIMIPVPSLERQKQIVYQYNQINKIIAIKERLNNNLEQQVDILYCNIFNNDTNVVELGSVIKTTSGGTPSRNNRDFYINGTYNWIKSKELQGTFIFDTEEKITENAVKQSSAKPIPIYSVLVAMYGANVGSFGITTKEATCNQAICALINNKNYPYSYIFWNIRLSKEQLKNMAVGSAQQNISQILIKQLAVHSDLESIKKFDTCAKVVMSALFNIQKEISNLTKLRDTLLPKLMLENSDTSADKLSFT